MSRQGQGSPVETRESAITANDRDNAGEFKTCTQPPSMSIRRLSTDESDDDEEHYHPHSKQGFLRPRQRSNGSSSSSSDMPPRSYSLGSENIRKFSQESLYSYSFTPSLPRSNRMRIMRHGMDFVRRIRCKLDDRVTRRYSHPDIGASTFDWQMNTWSTVNTPRTSIDYDSIVANGNGSDPTTMTATTTAHPMDDIPTTSSKQQRTSSMTKRPSPPDTSCNNAESCQSYRRILHTPTRFLPQNQAIFTTDHDGTILLFNDIASLCFLMDKSHVGQSLLSVLQNPFRDKTATLLRDRTAGDEDPVLVCGTVVPIIKTNGEKSAASLWLKRKERDGGKIVYIWIFEEILESTLTAYLDPKGNINQVIGKMQELYGYSNEQVIGKHISLLIPSLNADPSSTIDVAATMKFFGSQTKYGAFFPAMGTLHTNNDHTAFTLKIISLPTVAGMITIHTNGMIQSMSAVPAKYLFGYPTVDSLVEKVPISQLLPQLPEILDNLQRDGLWTEDGNIIGNTTCRRALVPRDLATTTDHKLSISNNNSNNSPLPVIYAVHHDGSQFEVQLRLRSITSAEGQLISIWVAFDRVQSLSKRNSTKRKASAVKPSSLTSPQQQHSNDDDNDPEEHNPNMDDNPHGHGHGHEKKARSTFRSRRVVQMAKARAPLPNRSLAPVVELSEPTSESPTTTSPDLDVSSPPPPAEQRPPPLPTDEHHPLDDYEILDTLGEGTYGAAKLAYRKDDEAQKMVVIKCIRKSRILVDSWMRDRRYGDIVPAEIHILRTLQQCPQQNCCSLLAHMEDQDFYYVVMALHGDGMDLFDYIELNEEICEQEVRAIFRQVAEAVRHLHHNKIVHRDIKDENIILDESGTVLLIDFGSAAYFRSGKKFETFCGTMEYWAPELLQGISYDGPPQDIWSLGILLHTLIFRETPFYQLDDILEDQLHIRDLPYPGPHDILHKMLNKDPSKRPTIDDVLADPWFVQ
ncbi:psk2p [Lichtheimia corymbifera JMRC:FSU:9682]|uniref:Psk2p n=1 Tax=Lichtheimia corymbifera JMRC:FSU:9682 TaxID=1263082 RepID=A0A068RWB9_9FUNG|nr:psk2p [Lichtheimia corymbifera JMRC:FSU:9682]